MMMPALRYSTANSINPHSTVPVYRQIVDAMRNHLVDGTLQPGDLVPPVRQLAVDLGVHFNTVAEAYRVLAAEGWLDLRHGRGAKVVERAQPATASRNEVADYRQRLRELISQMRARGVSTDRIAAELRALAEGLNS